MKLTGAQIETATREAEPLPWCGGAADLLRGEPCVTEGEKEKEKARRVPHHPMKLRRRADVEVRRRSGGITASQRRVDEAPPRENIVRSGAGVREEELDENPGPEAERRRWPAVAEVLRYGWTTAAQGRLPLRAPRCGGG